ncbi:MAG: glucosylceramidase [Treponema sp.]|nr:glucosylceramidase [Treponema sp.]
MQFRKVHIVQSVKGGELFQSLEPVVFERDPAAENEVINLYPEVTYQTIMGFGGAFTETSAYQFSRMSDAAQETIIKALFDPKEGLAYNFCRTHIHSCDFSISRYTYVEDEDTELKTFSIDRDRAYILPFIKAAQKAVGEDLWLFASPWSPPAWMKDNGDICHGGRLLDAYYAVWAQYFVRYCEEYRKEGIPFFGLTVQNEAMAWQTWESCVYTAQEEAVFAHQFLKPALKAAGFDDIRIMIWDHNKERVYERARDSFAVPGAKDSIWGIAFHWYSGTHFNALNMTHNAFPDKPLLLTESGIGAPHNETDSFPHGGWTGMAFYANEMIGNFNNYMAAEITWNLLIDEDGGPHHDRPFGCGARIMVNPATDEVILEPTYYATAHFSRFIKRGAVRIGTSSFSDRLAVTAFKNPDGEMVAVVLNRGAKTEKVRLRIEAVTAPLVLPGHSLTTLVVPV